MKSLLLLQVIKSSHFLVEVNEHSSATDAVSVLPLASKIRGSNEEVVPPCQEKKCSPSEL